MSIKIDILDIIIIGSGISGLYSAYNIKKNNPNITFLILEKYKKKWIGGRVSSELFYGVEVVTGAGVGRKDTNPLLIKLLNELNIKYGEFEVKVNFPSTIKQHVDIIKILDYLKKIYNINKKNPSLRAKTFKEFAEHVLGKSTYNNFVLTNGYSDYENADIYETLYNYGIEDNSSGWIALKIHFKDFINKLHNAIGSKHFRFSNNVISIEKINESPNIYRITTEQGDIYYTNKIILATTINVVQKLLPNANNSNSIYKEIHGQPFLRLYAKFDKKSSEVMKHYVPYYTIVPSVLQKIIPMDKEKGVYMIAYNDNENAIKLKDKLENNEINREFYSRLLEKSLGIHNGSLKILAIKDYYWPIGTHYFEPLSSDFKNRNQFLIKAQHPEKCLLVVGEAVSSYQGWMEGALESVENVLSNKWINTIC
jgi:protoporphyrinogen oxidase